MFVVSGKESICRDISPWRYILKPSFSRAVFRTYISTKGKSNIVGCATNLYELEVVKIVGKRYYKWISIILLIIIYPRQNQHTLDIIYHLLSHLIYIIYLTIYPPLIFHLRISSI